MPDFLAAGTLAPPRRAVPSSRRARVPAGLRFALAVLALALVSAHECAAATLRVPQDQPTLKAAIAAATSGDVIVLSPGVHAGGVLVENKVLRITSLYDATGDTAYVSQTIVSGGSGYCSGSSNCTGDVALEFGINAHGSAVVGLTVTSATKGVRSRSFVDILHCHVIGTSDGTNYNSGAGGTFRDNLFANNSDDGVDLNGDVVVRVIDNVIRNNGDDGIEFRLNAYSGPMATSEFTGNLISGNLEDGIQFIDYPDNSNRILRVEHNRFVGNAMAAVGLMANGATAEDFGGPPVPERIFVLYNTFVNNAYGCVGGANLVALGNVFTGTRNSATRRMSGTSIAAYNLFFGNGVDHDAVNVEAAHEIVADPQLDSGLAPLPGSPAIDAGVAFYQHLGETVLDLPSTAYAGSAPDIGAIETNLAEGPPALAIDDATVVEGGSGPANATLTVRLSRAIDDEVTVEYQTADGTATVADGDYTPAAGTVRLAPLATSVTIAFEVKGDATPESDEAFTVQLRGAVNAGIAKSAGRVTIVNDDVPPIVERRIVAGIDDAEESSTGSVSLTSGDLEMMIDSKPQRAVGLRFTNLTIPPGVTITNAWIQFKADEAQSEATTLTVRAHAIDNAPAFAAASGNLGMRPLTAAAVAWPTLPAWTAGQVTAAQRTPDLRSVILEIVARPGWRAGNALAVIVTGSGHRTAVAFEGAAAAAALLHVEFATGPVTNRPPVVEAGPDTTVALAGGARLRGTTFDDGLPAPSTSITHWTPVAGPGVVTLDDPPSLATRATFSAVGVYRLELMASDGEFEARDSVQITVVDAPPVASVVEARIAAKNDDGEESASGSVSLSSSDLEMMIDGSAQRAVGLRFLNLAIPPGATITSAWVQLKADEAQSEATSLTVRAHATDNAPVFATTSGNLSTRPVTAAAVAWPALSAWTAGQVTAAQRTPDLKSVIQEIVARPGWNSGNAMALIVTGSGHRTAVAFDGGATAAALLHVEFTAAVSASALKSGKATANAAALRLEARVAPNPARGMPHLLLAMPESGSVTVELFDPQGRRVSVPMRVLALAVGRHAIDLRGDGDGALNAGVYFYRVRTLGREMRGRFLVMAR